MHTTPRAPRIGTSLRRSLLLGLTLCAAAWLAAPAGASAQFGGLGGRLVLPQAALRAVRPAPDAALGWSLTVARSTLGPALELDDALATTDQLLNVINLFGRGFDLGLVAPEDGLAKGQLLLQLRTSLGRRRVLVRCVVRFS